MVLPTRFALKCRVDRGVRLVSSGLSCWHRSDLWQGKACAVCIRMMWIGGGGAPTGVVRNCSSIGAVAIPRVCSGYR
jgi:hypothetical protein